MGKGCPDSESSVCGKREECYTLKKGLCVGGAGGSLECMGKGVPAPGASRGEGVPTLGKGGPGTEGGAGREAGSYRGGLGQGGGVPTPPQPVEGRQPRGQHVRWNHRHPEGQGGGQGLGCTQRPPSFHPEQQPGGFPHRTHRGCRRNRPSCGESAGLRAQRGGHFIQRTEKSGRR